MDEAKIRAIIDRQANDEGCWFQTQTCAEAYLQERLRELHEVIEGKTRVECANELMRRVSAPSAG